jgi:hypothetical protein
LLVAVDKFSKWIEAVPVTNQEATTTVKFFESIVYRYGIPNSIITDNSTNFTSGEFQEFARKLGIKIKYASVAHPKSNGQVKKANGLICAGLKKRLLRPLKRAAGAWVEELPLVLWSLRTTPNSSTRYTPFFLLFGVEAVLPTDVCYRVPRVVAYVEEDAEKALADAQDVLDEARDVALARSAVYQQSLCNYHSRRGTRMVLRARQPCPSPQANKHLKAGATMGRAISRPQSNPRRRVSTARPQDREGHRQPMERTAVASVLPLEAASFLYPPSLCNYASTTDHAQL